MYIHVRARTHVSDWIVKGAQNYNNRSASKWPVKIGHCITDMHPHGAKKVPVLGLSSSFLLVHVFFLSFCLAAPMMTCRMTSHSY